MQDDNRPEPGTSEAYFLAAHAADTAAAKYRELAADVAEIRRRYRALEGAKVPEPELYEPHRPVLLSSRSWQWDRDQAARRLDNIELHVLAGAGVWQAQSGSWLTEGHRVLGAEQAPVDVRLVDDETDDSGDGPQ